MPTTTSAVVTSTRFCVCIGILGLCGSRLYWYMVVKIRLWQRFKSTRNSKPRRESRVNMVLCHFYISPGSREGTEGRKDSQLPDDLYAPLFLDPRSIVSSRVCGKLCKKETKKRQKSPKKE